MMILRVTAREATTIVNPACFSGDGNVDSDLQRKLVSPFSYLLDHAELAASVARLTDMIADHPAVLAARKDSAAVKDVHAEIKTAQAADGRAYIDRFYWSLQLHSGAHGHQFHSYTLNYSAKSGVSTWSEFPEDSYLTSLCKWPSGMSGQVDHANQVDVLRYVPLRRFTFLLRMGDEPPVIGKVKRRSRYMEAWNRLTTVCAFVSASQPPFSVAAPLKVFDSSCLYLQTVLPGEDVTRLLNPENAGRLMHRIGHLHHALHRTPVLDLPLRRNLDWLAGAEQDLHSIFLLLPSATEELRSLPALLRNTLPEDGSPSFCHGDFVCSQLLLDSDRWSITDFDLCHLGDPYRDIAMLMASLPDDVPLVRAVEASHAVHSRQAELASHYLRGYQDAAGHRLEPRRLLWHRLCAELYYLALALKKGRFDANLFFNRSRDAISLADQLAS